MRKLAGQLPMVMHNTLEVHIMTGQEILDMGYVLHEGQVIDPEVNYRYNQPVQIAANHFRRLKRAYYRDGKLGLVNYVIEIKELAQQQKNEE